MKINIEVSVDEFKALTQKEPCDKQGSISVKNTMKINQEELEEELKKKLNLGFQ